MHNENYVHNYNTYLCLRKLYIMYLHWSSVLCKKDHTVHILKKKNQIQTLTTLPTHKPGSRNQFLRTDFQSRYYFTKLLHEASSLFILFLLLLFSHSVWLFVTSWTAASQASLSFTIFRRLLKILLKTLFLKSLNFRTRHFGQLVKLWFKNYW